MKITPSENGERGEEDDEKSSVEHIHLGLKVNARLGDRAKARGAKVRRVLPFGHPPGCSLGVPRPAGDLARVTRLKDVWPATSVATDVACPSLLGLKDSGSTVYLAKQAGGVVWGSGHRREGGLRDRR